MKYNAYMNTLGNVINEYRRTHSMSMDVFAERSGLSKSYISMLEKNRDGRGNPIAPSLETISKVAKGMGCSFDAVFNQLDPAQRITINTKDSYEASPADSLVLSDEETRIILRYRQMNDSEKNLVCTMMQVKRDPVSPSIQTDNALA